MAGMIPMIVLLVLLTVPALAQVPPGLPYDKAKHPNAIVTYVTNADFKTSTYTDARDLSDIELLGLSQDEARRDSIQVAQTTLKRVKIGGRDFDVTFYPVVRQVFTLTDGNRFVLHSFKFPRVPFPRQLAEQILNEAALMKMRRPEEGRFGLSPAPEQLEIRGAAAFLFDDEGELTLFWTEGGAAHTVTAKIPQSELFRLVEDLL
jgi:hypothetical protein